MLFWRRSQERDLIVKGHSISETADILRVDKSTVSKDMKLLAEQAEIENRDYIKKLPNEHSKCIRAFDMLQKEGWLVVEEAKAAGDRRDRLAAIEVLKGIVALREEGLGNGQIISEANRIANEKSAELNRIRGEPAKINAEAQLALDTAIRLGQSSDQQDHDQPQPSGQDEEQSKENNDNTTIR